MEWLDFLRGAGGEFEDRRLMHFGSPSRECKLIHSGDVICPLTEHVLLAVSGADAGDFLANQLSNDVYRLTDTQGQFSSFCTHQGRVVANFFIFKKSDVFYLLIARDLAEYFIERISRFILRTEVEIRISHNLVAMEIYGRKASEYAPDFPADFCAMADWQGATLVNLSGSVSNDTNLPHSRGLIIASPEQMTDIWRMLNVHCVPVGFDAWQMVAIRAGIPMINDASKELFIPHMLNFQQIPMVDFKKGCYPGQEVVARMEYLGKNKRQMYRIAIKRTTPLSIGEKLISDSSSSAKGAGQIVMAAIDADGQMAGLAVVEQIAFEANDVKDSDGNAVSIEPIEYNF